MAPLSPRSAAVSGFLRRSGKIGGMTLAAVLSRADELAETVLYPSAPDVDDADRIPAAHLDALAAAGLYGLAGPAAYGGLELGLPGFCRVIETLAGGCLATTFVWIQHHSAVRALAAAPNDALREAWLGPLIRGQRRAGIALGGVRPGAPPLQARPVPGGYVLDGDVPWVTGWGMVDVVYTMARRPDGNLVSALLPAAASATLTAARLDLVAVNASATVELSFANHLVPDELVCATVPYADWLARDAQGLRPNGSLALGVAARCGRLAGSGIDGTGPFAAELDAIRDRLDGADVAAMPAARAAAAELAFRASGAAVAAAGSRGILARQQPQRLAREALFLLVFGSRPAIKENLVRQLSAR
jgi:alkylation response protein AidB-like acyl-CoA dehydrogenase